MMDLRTHPLSSTRKTLTLIIDEIPHVFTVAGGCAELDGEQIVRVDERVSIPFFGKYAIATHENLATCATLQGLVNAFITRMLLGLPVDPKYTVEWYTLTCNGKDVQLPGCKKDLRRFDFNDAIKAVSTDV